MNGRALRDLLSEGPVIAPGAYDALTACLVADAGFSTAFVSGAAVSATQLGRPDLGFVSPTDVVATTRTVAATRALSAIIVDADTGWGDGPQVAEHVRRLEHAGAAAIIIEDQVWPKRCGSLGDKHVVGSDEMTVRLDAALGARESALIVARTDAASVVGLDDAVRRAGIYAATGVDLVFVSGVTSPDTLAAIRDRTSCGLVVNCSEAATPAEGWPTIAEMSAAGGELFIVPVLGLLSAVSSTRRALSEFASRGTAALGTRADWDELGDVLAVPRTIGEPPSPPQRGAAS